MFIPKTEQVPKEHEYRLFRAFLFWNNPKERALERPTVVIQKFCKLQVSNWKLLGQIFCCEDLRDVGELNREKSRFHLSIYFPAVRLWWILLRNVIWVIYYDKIICMPSRSTIPLGVTCRTPRRFEVVLPAKKPQWIRGHAVIFSLRMENKK